MEKLVNYEAIAVQFLLLLLALKINRKLEHAAPNLWLFVPIFLSAVQMGGSINWCLAW